jgi:hypothetical protein
LLEELECRLTPSTYTVNAITDAGAGSGLTGDLRYCLTQANTAGGANTINFDSTVFANPQTTIILKSALPAITDNGLTITGPGAGLVTIDGDNLFDVFTITANNVTISNVTISNGVSTLNGGGINYSGVGTLTLTNAVISGDTAGAHGGGVYSSNPLGKLTFTNSYFYDNYAYYGGGICSNSSKATLTGCIFSGNTAGIGAGMLSSGTASLSKCIFVGNSANVSGAIGNSGTATITNCSFYQNFASGGGVMNNHGIATFTGCYMFENQANEGSAIRNANTLTLTGSTLTGNFAFGSGAVANYGVANISSTTFSKNLSLFGFAGLANFGTATVNKVTMSGNMAYATFTSGGFFNAGNLTLTSSTITGNTGFVGGGVNVGTMNLGSDTFTLNKGVVAGYVAGATYGIGGALYNGNMATINKCTLSSNTTVSVGGGVFNRGNLSVINSTISGNSVTSSGPATGGGGIANFNSLSLLGSTLSGNLSNTVGGGVYNMYYKPTSSPYSYFGTASVVNCTLSGNISGTNGGGVYDKGVSSFTNATISANKANGSGGGVDHVSTTLQATVNNTIVAGNSGFTADPDFLGAVNTTSGFNLIGDGTGLTGITNGSQGNQIGTSGAPINPMLGALASNGGPTMTMAELTGSPAIDKGSNALAVDMLGHPLKTDQRGDTRVVNSTVDIGAFEVQATPHVILWQSTHTSVYSQPVTLTATITPPQSGSPVPTGTVQFVVNGQSLGTPVPVVNGVATLTTQALPVGNPTIRAVYNGDTYYHSARSDVVNHTVTKDGTTTKLASSSSQARFGQNVTFTATVGAAQPGLGTPTGSVTFGDGATVLATVPISNGTASFVTSGLAVGHHKITAKYNGSNHFQVSSALQLTETINPGSNSPLFVLPGQQRPDAATPNAASLVAADPSTSTQPPGAGLSLTRVQALESRTASRTVSHFTVDRSAHSSNSWSAVEAGSGWFKLLQEHSNAGSKPRHGKASHAAAATVKESAAIHTKVIHTAAAHSEHNPRLHTAAVSHLFAVAHKRTTLDGYASLKRQDRSEDDWLDFFND